MKKLNSFAELFYIKYPQFKTRAVTNSIQNGWDCAIDIDGVNHFLNTKTRLPSNNEWNQLHIYKEFVELQTGEHVPVGDGKYNMRWLKDNSGVVLVNRDLSYIATICFSNDEILNRNLFQKINRSKQEHLIRTFTGWCRVETGYETWSMRDRSYHRSETLVYYKNGKRDKTVEPISLGGRNSEYWSGDAYYGYKASSTSNEWESDPKADGIKIDATFVEFTRDVNEGQEFTSIIRDKYVDHKLMYELLIKE